MRNTIMIAALLLAANFAHAVEPDTLPGTKPLTAEGDIAAQLVAGVDTFLLRKIDESVEKRAHYWKRDFSSPEAYNKSIEPNRQRLAKMLGVQRFDDSYRDGALNDAALEVPLYEHLNGCDVSYVKIPVLSAPSVESSLLGVVHVEALYIHSPKDAQTKRVVFIPHEPESLEIFLREEPSLSEIERVPFVLARHGYHVLIPLTMNRKVVRRGDRIDLTHREFLYRNSFELGRHPLGYEVQKLIACGAWLMSNIGCRSPSVSYYGFGDGGQSALYAGAIDPRVNAVCVAHYFDERNQLWQEPLDRNLFGLLDEFGDAEIASLVAARRVIVDSSEGRYAYEMASKVLGGQRLSDPAGRQREFERLRDLVDDAKWTPRVEHFTDSRKALAAFVDVDDVAKLKDRPSTDGATQSFEHRIRGFRLHAMDRQVGEMVNLNELLLAESPYVRKERFWDKLDYSSVEAFEKSVAPFREEFKHDVIGHFDDQPLPFNPRTRKAYDEEKWVGYEVMLDLWPDVFCYGILCLPKDMKQDGSEKRPVVVCQHGLEGRPQDIVKGDHPAYHDFASKLCERGFITFAPQNLYIGKDKFRTLQRKANPLGKTLFSIITPQHQQILDWLKAQPYVDGERIGFYGLSYGGKTAMRVPPLVDDYKCVICSADFNDWVWKNASTRSPYSYVWTGEYEIFEWNLAHTFNYAEMAALIAPRPFMVERGHFDGVAPDERVAYEFAKVRHLYNARLKLPADHCQIEWFDGPHTINGKGTFAFLHKHLDWPEQE